MEGPDSTALAFPAEQIAAYTVAFDVVAQPARTPFIQAAERAGRSVISGAEVIVLQAVDQFALYTGIRPDSATIADAAAFAHGPEAAAQILALPLMTFNDRQPVTLSRFLIEQQRLPGCRCPAELRLLIETVARACKAVGHAISKGRQGLGHCGSAGSISLENSPIG